MTTSTRLVEKIFGTNIELCDDLMIVLDGFSLTYSHF